MKRCGGLLFVGLVMMMLHSVDVYSQTAAVSFRQLEARQLLKHGDTVTIIYTTEDESESVVSGSFLRLTPTAITVRSPHSAEHIEIAELDVRRIVQERKDTVWKGAFIGAGIGLGYGVISIAAFCSGAWECGPGETAGYVLFTAGIGFGIGALVDAMSGGPQTEVVYLDPRQAGDSLTVRVAPILTAERKGVGVVVSW